MAIDPKLQKMLLETFKAELQEIHQSLISSLLSLEKNKDEEELKTILKTLFRHSHNLKGAAASVSIKAITSMAHHLEDLFSQWRDKTHFPTEKEINACLQVADNFLLAFKQFEQGEETDTEQMLLPLKGGKISPKKLVSQVSEFITLPLSRIETVSAKANEFIVYRLKLLNWFKTLESQVKEIENSKTLTPSFLKQMSDIIAESGQFFGEFSRSVQSLQDELKSMRMLPISTILTPLERTVRDIAKQLGKSVELEVYGGDIELDKAILDGIKDALQHLIRNAIDHGIEPDAERGDKSIPARLNIKVTQSAGKIILQVTDDGRGIDAEKVKQHAIKQGFCSAEEISHLNKEQILEFIFSSGFSLQKKVTEISGRGVGLDAVRADLQKIRATVHLETRLNKGTVFTLILPLTLATTRGVFFKIKEQIFMLPTLSIAALYAIMMDEITLVNNQPFFIIDEKPIPVVNLNGLLQNKALPINQNYFGLLIDYGETKLIFLVDSIVNEHECVVKPLPEPFSAILFYIGVTLTGDSDLVLVLEANQLKEMALKKEGSFITAKKPTEKIKEIKKKILIVDDSLTTRSLCANALEAAGFDTYTAIDGQKAWERVQQESFDCVITDLVMPNLDGFELTQLIKNDPNFEHIPVIVVSLLDSKEDKEKGLQVGANAFLAKSEFDTHSLIETMDSLL